MASPSTTAMKEGDYVVDWLELPTDLTSSILVRLSAIEIVENAQEVCRSWRRICKDPSMWRKIAIHNSRGSENPYYEKLCRHVVDRSQGGLVEIDRYFGSDSLLSYIVDSSSKLRSFKVSGGYNTTSEGLMVAVSRLPLLEELEVSYSPLSGESLKVIGQSCPNLKTLKKNWEGYRWRSRDESDAVALAIAETMPRLCHLELVADRLTDVGLNAILDGCPNLEHLDLRHCFNVDLVGDLEKRCIERIKVVRRPYDSVHDDPFDDVCLTDVDDDYAYVYSEDEYYHDLSDASDTYEYDPYDFYLC